MHLVIEKDRVTENETIEAHMKDFFQQLYTEEVPCWPVLTGLNLKHLVSDLPKELECDFTEEEVKQALDDLAGDKTLGPDGFPLKFYSFYWPFIKKDIHRVSCTFYKNRFLEWHLNTNFISLILKKNGASSVRDL